MAMRKIGFAGTAKNTGKTTTALHILARANATGLTAALTSIGYDGEHNDHITGLPKPRYTLPAGALLATAESCLPLGTAVCNVLERTSIQTILGRILICRVERAGSAVLAGPNRAADLNTVFHHFEAMGADGCLIDGALNRVAPLAAADGLVLSTGAAFDEAIPAVAAHAAAMQALFALPAAPDTSTWRIPAGSLLSAQALDAALSAPSVHLEIPGACRPELAARLLQTGRLESLTFGSPLKLIASGDPRDWQAVLALAQEKHIRLAVRQSVPIRLVTVNPFYPRYLGRSGSYEAASVDKVALLASVRAAMSAFPVVDIFQPPLPDLLKWVGLTD